MCQKRSSHLTGFVSYARKIKQGVVESVPCRLCRVDRTRFPFGWPGAGVGLPEPIQGDLGLTVLGPDNVPVERENPT